LGGTGEPDPCNLAPYTTHNVQNEYGTLASGASTTFGFNVSYTGTSAAPASLSCT
jgi:hypothetical protein